MTDRELFRHAVATVAYRAQKATRDAPTSFANARPGASSRTPVEILAHMGDLFDWALSMAKGTPTWNNTTPRAWDEEWTRFFASVQAFDDILASDADIQYDLTRLLQGPVADALTHVGQLAMLRRLHGVPMKSESYNRADVVVGRVGSVQTPAEPRYEFE